MISELKQLTNGLVSILNQPAKNIEVWFDTKGIERAKARVIAEHGGASIDADPRTIMDSVQAFQRTGKALTFRELKYVCLGVGIVNEEGWCILSDEKLRRKLFNQVEHIEVVHRTLRAFQALLSAYFTLSLSQSSPAIKVGWKELRLVLNRHRAILLKKIDFRPPWFNILEKYKELLTDKPCEKFGEELLRGDTSGLEEALYGLAINSDSWVIEETVLAQIRMVVKLGDRAYKERLPEQIRISLGCSGLKVSEALRIKCISLLVSRYSRSTATPEDFALRDAALSVIGNPWLRKTNWDAHVVLENGEPDNWAREMIFGWLKGRLIQDFFELLSDGGTGDARRLSYWLRFAPFIDDMWFALGSTAQARQDNDFKEFKGRATGRLLDLEGTTSDNNAFMMRIGEFLAVEFGVTGNAFYLIRWDSLSRELKKVLTSGRTREFVYINSLKPKPREELMEIKKTHTDSPSSLRSWEQKFDDDLLPVLGVNPKERPACVPELEELLKGRDVVVTDTRINGGSLRIQPAEELLSVAKRLSALGFVLKTGLGWSRG